MKQRLPPALSPARQMRSPVEPGFGEWEWGLVRAWQGWALGREQLKLWVLRGGVRSSPKSRDW